MLEVRDLKTYFFTPSGVIRAVDGISYDVREGETTAIVALTTLVTGLTMNHIQWGSYLP